MKKMMSLFVVLLLSVSLMTGLSGCGKTKYTNPGKDYEVDLDVDYQISETLTIGLYLQTDLDVQHFKEVEKAFKLHYRNVNIKLQNFSGSNYYSELSKAYQAENMPDIFMVNSAMSFVGIEKGLLLNLDPYIQAEEAIDSEYEEQFVESMWKLGQENYDGDQFFIPRSADRIVTHYNKKIFNDAKIDMSLVKNGWTWEDFLTVCDKLESYYRANKGGAAFLNAEIQWESVLFPMMESLGAKVFNDDQSIALDSDAQREFLAMLKNLLDKNYINPSNTTPVDFVSGNAAMTFHSQPANYYIDNLGDDYDVVTFPLIGEDKTQSKIGAGIAGYGIFSGIDAQKRDLAWKFLDFMLSKDGQNAMARSGLTVPPIRVDMQNPNTNEWGKDKADINMEAYVWEPERNFATNFYLGFPPEKQSELVNAVYVMVADHLRNPDGKSADTVIANCGKAIQNILKSI